MITVVVATHNGADRIGHSLASFTALAAPIGGWRLVVVDNGSTDGTASVLEGFLDRLPLQILRRSQPGKNAALNRGLEHVEGELVVFTDDDVIADPDWLVQLTAAAAAEPDYTVFGGSIRPEWPQPPEQWILDWVPLGPVFTATPPMDRGPCTPYAIWGPNMAIRREVFRAGLRFDEAIGPDGTARYAMGSETSLTRRLAAKGHRCFHVPEAVVGHLVRSWQMTRTSILQRAYRGGRGKGLLAQELDPTVTIADVPRYFFREAAQAALRFGSARLRGDERGAFRAAWEWNHALGCISGARAASVSAAGSHARPVHGDAPTLHAPTPA